MKLAFGTFLLLLTILPAWVAITVPLIASAQPRQSETTNTLTAATAALAQDAKEVLRKVQERLKPALADLAPKAEVKYPNHSDSLEIFYLAQKFLVHPGSKTGERSTNAVEQIGPSFKGFVLRAHVQPLGQVNQAFTPQTIREPYWETLLEITPVAGTTNQIYWALSFGGRADKQVLEKVKEALASLAGAGPGSILEPREVRGASGTPPQSNEHSAKGLQFQCSLVKTNFVMGEPVNIWCEVTNTTDETKSLAWHPSTGSHYCLVQGETNWMGGVLPLVVPQLRDDIKIKSTGWSPEYLLFVPPHSSVTLLLTYKPDRPEHFRGRVVYDPMTQGGGFSGKEALEKAKQTCAFSNVINYQVKGLAKNQP